MSDVLQITVDDSRVRALFREFPKITNSEANRAYKRVISQFMKRFSSERLVKGVFTPRRGRKAKKNPTGQPAIPAKARLAGFKARVGGVQRLEGKYVYARTSNPLMLVRERGETIYAKKKRPGDKRPWLYIRGTPHRAFGTSKRGKARRAKWQAKHVSGQKWAHWAKPVVAKKEKVGPFKRLGFMAAWNAFYPEASRMLQEIVSRSAKRANQFLERRRKSA